MSGVLVSFWPGAQSLEGLAPRVEERWPGGSGAGRRRLTVAAVLVPVVSLAVHVGLVAMALVREEAPPPHREIAVEVVSEVPKPAEKPPEPASKAEAPPAPKAADPPPPEPKTIEKAEAPRPQAADAPAEMKPSLPPQAKAGPPEPSKPDADMKALQDELAALRAEHAALAAQNAAEPPASAAAPAGLGPLADSFQAVALPTQSEDGDLPVGYAAIVFSQLAKAKQIGEEMGQPGTAAVSFAVDDTGALAGVDLVTSSGIKTLDDEALSLVRKAAPFPPPPPGAQRRFSANVSFVGRAAP